jgi:hypothetical protein
LWWKSTRLYETTRLPKNAIKPSQWQDWVIESTKHLLLAPHLWPNAAYFPSCPDLLWIIVARGWASITWLMINQDCRWKGCPWRVPDRSTATNAALNLPNLSLAVVGLQTRAPAATKSSIAPRDRPSPQKPIAHLPKRIAIA